MSSRCCPVQTTRHLAQGALRTASITGAILMASGRVPIAQSIVLIPSRSMNLGPRAGVPAIRLVSTFLRDLAR